MKNYISNNLVNGESVVYQTKLHWFVYSFSIILACVMALSFVFFGIAGFAVCAIVLPVAGISFLLNWLRRKFFGFAVTNKRIIAKPDFLKTVDVSLKHVESVRVEQGFWGAILDFGSVIVTGTGGTKSILPNVANPDKFRSQIMAQIA